MVHIWKPSHPEAGAGQFGLHSEMRLHLMKIKKNQAAEMDPYLRCLLLRCEAHSLDLQNPHKILGGCGSPDSGDC